MMEVESAEAPADLTAELTSLGFGKQAEAQGTVAMSAYPWDAERLALARLQRARRDDIKRGRCPRRAKCIRGALH